jgi:ubiquinone/menaquinone biosynthesis C-methylase UbiE
VARYIQTKDGSRVQFLEPDMKKLQRLPDGMKYIDEVERVVKEEGARLVEELRKK